MFWADADDVYFEWIGFPFLGQFPANRRHEAATLLVVDDDARSVHDGEVSEHFGCGE